VSILTIPALLILTKPLFHQGEWRKLFIYFISFFASGRYTTLSDETSAALFKELLAVRLHYEIRNHFEQVS